MDLWSLALCCAFLSDRVKTSTPDYSTFLVKLTKSTISLSGRRHSVFSLSRNTGLGVGSTHLSYIIQSMFIVLSDFLFTDHPITHRYSHPLETAPPNINLVLLSLDLARHYLHTKSFLNFRLY